TSLWTKRQRAVLPPPAFGLVEDEKGNLLGGRIGVVDTDGEADLRARFQLQPLASRIRQVDVDRAERLQARRLVLEDGAHVAGDRRARRIAPDVGKSRADGGLPPGIDQ